jgi:hypothetical protein
MRYILPFLVIFCLFSVSVSNAQTTYYSYRGINNSSWNDPLTWTTTVNGEDSQNPSVPGNGDIVYIVQNRTVLLPANIATTGLRVIVEEGSILDFNSFTFTSGFTGIIW